MNASVSGLTRNYCRKSDDDKMNEGRVKNNEIIAEEDDYEYGNILNKC